MNNMNTANDANSFVGLSFQSTSTYNIIEEIGRGGMGIVFLAEKQSEGVSDMVALKTLKTLSEKHEARLRHEGNIATHLRHENIVKTYGLEAIPFSVLPDNVRKDIQSLSFDTAVRKHEKPVQRRNAVKSYKRIEHSHAKKMNIAATNKKLLVLVMDFIDGTDCRTILTHHIKSKYLMPCKLAAFIVARIARALAYAHQHIIHRDISPENILIDTHGACKLSDFGVSADDKESLALFAGKLCYMSPEQLAQETVDARTDIFSLGIVAYQLLTGINPLAIPKGLKFNEQLTLVQERLNSQIVPPTEIIQGIPQVLSDIVMKMLQVDREKRYHRCEDVQNALEQGYLYAEGFGPTNNSLAAYIDIISKGFKDYSKDQLRQLSFLTNEEGKIALIRPIKASTYTKKGIEEIVRHPWSLLFNIIAREKMAGQ